MRFKTTWPQKPSSVQPRHKLQQRRPKLLRLKPRFEADVGRLEVEIRLRNLDAREMAGELALDVAAEDGPPSRLRREFRIQGGMERNLAMTLSMPGVRRWSPWRFGAQHLYDAALRVDIDGLRSAAVRDRFGFRDLEVREGPEGWIAQLKVHAALHNHAGLFNPDFKPPAARDTAPAPPPAAMP